MRALLRPLPRAVTRPVSFLLLVAWISGKLDIPFSISGFPPKFSLDALVWAFVGAIVLSIINTIIGHFVED